MAAACSQRADDRGKLRGCVLSETVTILLAGAVHMVTISNDARRHVLDRHHVIDLAGRGGALGHSRHGVMVEFSLGERQAPVFLDHCKTQRTIAAGARQDDAYGVRALIFGKRLQESVDRPAAAARRRGAFNFQATPLDRKRCIGRNDVNAVGLDLDIIDRLDDGHFCYACEQLAQHALVVG